MKVPLKSLVRTGLPLLAQATILSTAGAEQVKVDAKLLEDLQKVINRQQQQIAEQSQVLRSLQRQLSEMKTDAAAAKTEAKRATAAVATVTDPAEAPRVVSSERERIKVNISGQLNRAMNVAEDGHNTNAYFVDNAASNSRFRFIGDARLTDDLSIGTKMEYAFTANLSSEVSQDNEDSGDFLDARWVDVSLTSKSYGTLYLGKGSTASDGSSEQDLSRTDVVQYAAIADIMGGLKFRDNREDLTDIRVSDAFKDFDGLSRQDRIRYDSPSLSGLKIQTSAISDQRWDGALFWGGETETLKLVAAGAVAEPNNKGVDLQYNGSFSMLHEPTGLNLTLSAGMQDADDGGNPSNLWGKLGYLAKLFTLGDTAFAVDYGLTNNLPDPSFDGYSLGGAVVQHLDDYGTELYAQFRRYKLDQDGGPNPKAINGGTLGARVKF